MFNLVPDISIYFPYMLNLGSDISICFKERLHLENLLWSVEVLSLCILFLLVCSPIRVILMFAFRGSYCGGFFVQIKSEQSLRQSYLVISCKLCYLILFLLFNFYQIQISNYIKGENAAKLLHYVFMK